MEEIALIALPRDHFGNLEDESVLSLDGSMGSLRLPASNGIGQNDSLPNLSGAGGSRLPSSVSSSMSERQRNRSLRILMPDPDGAMVPNTLPPFGGWTKILLLNVPLPLLSALDKLPSQTSRSGYSIIWNTFEFTEDGRGLFHRCLAHAASALRCSMRPVVLLIGGTVWTMSNMTTSIWAIVWRLLDMILPSLKTSDRMACSHSRIIVIYREAPEQQ